MFTFAAGLSRGLVVALVLATCSSTVWGANFVTSGTMSEARETQNMVLLQDGTVLVAGGFFYIPVTGTTPSSIFSILKSADRYTPATNTWVSTGNMITARSVAGMSMLSGGSVLISAGQPDEDVYTNTCEIYNPSTGVWSATGSVATARSLHTSTLLQNGKVLITGGQNAGSGGQLSSTEIYDPVTGSWTAGASMATARCRHKATLLSNGKVVVIGGFSTTSVALSSVEIYDPALNTWSAGTPMTVARAGPTATLLSNGNILVAGGGSGSTLTTYHSVAEVYNPTANTWTTVGSMTSVRQNHAASLLTNGDVLVTGGDTASAYLASAELYNSTSATWTATGNMSAKRYAHASVAFPNGKALVTGGESMFVTTEKTTDIFTLTGGTTITNLLTAYATAGSPFTYTITATGNAPITYAATGLPAGLTLTGATISGTPTVAGVFPIALTATNTIDSDTKTLTLTIALPGADFILTTSMSAVRSAHTMNVLQDNTVLVAGGANSTSYTAITERYDPTPSTWATVGSLLFARGSHTMTTLTSGKAFVTGGIGTGSLFLRSTELFNPTTNTWAVSGDMIAQRSTHTATLLQSGQVLAVGGFNGSSRLSTAETYNESTGLWTGAASMVNGRDHHTATLLANGNVLVVGGFTGSAALTSVEIYNPSSNTWTPGPAITTGRYDHTATLLPSGLVLIAGGSNLAGTGITTAERYDPTTNTWTSAGTMVVQRQLHTTTLLSNGKVLATGGFSSSSATAPLTSAEIYDPATNTWTAVGTMNIARRAHTAVPLSNGKLLVSGGVSSVTPSLVYTNTTELYNPKPVITSLLTASAVKDVAFSYTITAVGANPITFTTSALPAGLTLSAGVISGIPTVTGTFSITLIATNVAGSDSQTLVLVITPPVAPIITSALATIAIKSSAFTYQITATGTLSITYSATGLPAGLTLVGDTLTGTPTVGGVYLVVLLATNVAGSDSKTLTIAIGKGGAPNAVSVFTSSPTATPNPALVGQVITLLAVATDADGDAMSYTWDFGDGTTGTGASPTHTYAATGIYLVKVTVFDGVSTVTGTVTITVTAAGSAVAQPLSLQKASIKFNFAKSSGGDSMSFTGTLPLAKGFTPSGKTLTVKTGTYLSSFTLLGKGSGVAGHDSIKLTGKLKNGAFTTTPVKFIYTVKSSTVFSSLSSLGFTNADTAGTSISVPVTLVIDGTTYAGTISVNYKATENRNGSAK